jgi:outer membrane receptor protein involved in Fe transport
MKMNLTRIFSVLCCLGFSVHMMSAQSTVTGVITSDEDGQPLVGATILVKGTTTGTVSDDNGSFTITTTAANNILVVSYTGFRTQEVKTEGKSSLSLVMILDASTFSDVVVSATRAPIRKLESTTAITTIGAKQLEAVKPEGIAEAVFGTPGMYASFAQGRFRGGIYTRGFPDGSGNGLVYTSVMIDGLPALASASRPPDFAFSFDPNVDRVEVVRGNAATLFGRSAAAGVVNVITRTGGTKLSGTVRTTIYNKNVDKEGIDRKIEFNLNGPLNASKTLRFNVGGLVLRDNGFRNMGYPDKGSQLRFNVDYLIPEDKGSVRVYGQYIDLTIQNNIDIPFRLSDNLPRAGWKTTDSYYFPGLDKLSYSVTNRQGTRETRSIGLSNEEGNYATGIQAGLDVKYKLAKGLTFANHVRYQNYDHGTKFNLGVSPFYKDASFSQVRVLIDGDGNDTELMDEFRLTYETKPGKMEHQISAGGFFTLGQYTPTTYSLTGWNTLDIGRLEFKGFAGPPTFPPSTVGSQSRIDDYNVGITAFFLGDEMKIGDKLRLTTGLRYDAININLKGFWAPTPPATSVTNVDRTEKHADWSASVGFNYLLGLRNALYGSVVRAYRMPDYDAYSPARPTSLTANPRITDNEVVYNTELGYRTGLGDFTLDLAGFYTRINNRLATVYEGAIAVQRPFGTNQIRGVEIAATYTPAVIRGLLVQGSITIQDATFLDFKIPVVLNATTRKPNFDVDGNLYGNVIIKEGVNAQGANVYSIDLKGKQLPVVPARIINVTANYDQKYFGLNANLNANIKTFQDATNIYRSDDFYIVNLGAYAKIYTGKINYVRIGINGKNMLNSQKALRMLYVTNTDGALVKKQEIDTGRALAANTYYCGIPLQPRRILFTLEYRF